MRPSVMKAEMKQGFCVFETPRQRGSGATCVPAGLGSDPTSTWSPVSPPAGLWFPHRLRVRRSFLFCFFTVTQGLKHDESQCCKGRTHFVQSLI